RSQQDGSNPWDGSTTSSRPAPIVGVDPIAEPRPGDSVSRPVPGIRKFPPVRRVEAFRTDSSPTVLANVHDHRHEARPPRVPPCASSPLDPTTLRIVERLAKWLGDAGNAGLSLGWSGWRSECS